MSDEKKRPPYRNRIEVGSVIVYRGREFHLTQIEHKTESDLELPNVFDHARSIPPRNRVTHTLIIEAVLRE